MRKIESGRLGAKVEGGTVIRYKKGPAIRYTKGPSIRYIGPKFRDFFLKGSRYKVHWVKIANFF